MKKPTNIKTKKKNPKKIATFDTPDLLLKMRKSTFIQATQEYLENSIKTK